MNQHIKLQLYNKCLEFVEQRISNIQEALAAASESGNDETKSSAGDKHETSRAMMQLEQEKSGKQLTEAFELKNTLDRIVIDKPQTTVANGSLILTNNGNFFIAISAGKIIVDNIIYFAISSSSPLGKVLMGLSKKSSVQFNGKEYVIEQLI